MFDPAPMPGAAAVPATLDTSMLVSAASLVRRNLPVHPALAPLCADPNSHTGAVAGLECGTVASVSGSTSLALALVGAASQAGSWVAVVGLPDLGLGALEGCGVDPDRVLVIDDVASGELPRVLGILLGAVDVVVAGPSSSLPPRVGRRLATVVRERSTVVVTVGWELPGMEPRLRLRVAADHWEGLGCGHGHLRCRLLTVERSGRGRAAQPRCHRVWLPDANGELRVADPDEGPGASATVMPWRQ